MDVVVWLQGLGLGKYEATFREPPAVVMPCVPWLPVTILICADELCIGEYMAPHCSLDLRFRRAS